MNEVVAFNVTDQFRATAAENMKTYADETVHQLLDRYLDLTSKIRGAYVNTAPGFPELSVAGRVLLHERNLVSTVIEKRFGINIYSSGDEAQGF